MGLALQTRTGGKRIVAGREYLNRQAATLLRFAKPTTGPEMAAGLVKKAADLKELAEDNGPDGGDNRDESQGT